MTNVSIPTSTLYRYSQGKAIRLFFICIVMQGSCIAIYRVPVKLGRYLFCTLYDQMYRCLYSATTACYFSAHLCLAIAARSMLQRRGKLRSSTSYHNYLPTLWSSEEKYFLISGLANGSSEGTYSRQKYSYRKEGICKCSHSRIGFLRDYVTCKLYFDVCLLMVN